MLGNSKTMNLKIRSLAQIRLQPKCLTKIGINKILNINSWLKIWILQFLKYILILWSQTWFCMNYPTIVVITSFKFLLSLTFCKKLNESFPLEIRKVKKCFGVKKWFLYFFKCWSIFLSSPILNPTLNCLKHLSYLEE